MKRRLFLSLLCLLWVIIFIKTILAIQYDGMGASAHYYGVMLENSWQAHFNVDLLFHTLLFAFWIFYREKSKVVGLLCGAAAIYFGAVFSMLYLILVVIRSKSDVESPLKGNNVVVS